MLKYLRCRRVKSSTSTKPAKFARPDSEMNEGALIGGTRCKKSYYFYNLSLLTTCSKIALFSVTWIKLCWNVTLIPSDFAYSYKNLAYLGTINIVGDALINYGGVGIDCLDCHFVAQRYIIFWAAPAHLKGSLGSVKMALPPLNLFPKVKVFWAKL